MSGWVPAAKKKKRCKFVVGVNEHVPIRVALDIAASFIGSGCHIDVLLPTTANMSTTNNIPQYTLPLEND